MKFRLIIQGKQRYLCYYDEHGKADYLGKNSSGGVFFTYVKSSYLSTLDDSVIWSDKRHMDIKEELKDLVSRLDADIRYSYDEMIKPLLRSSIIKKLGI